MLTKMTSLVTVLLPSPLSMVLPSGRLTLSLVMSQPPGQSNMSMLQEMACKLFFCCFLLLSWSCLLPAYFRIQDCQAYFFAGENELCHEKTHFLRI